MVKALKSARARGAPGPALVAEFSVDPILVGADRELAGTFPSGLLEECGLVPLRRYHDMGLVVPRSGGAGRKGLERARKSSRLRLVEVPAIHDYGVELFLRYLQTGDENGPPVWVQESRRAYLTRQGDVRAPQAATLISSLVLTSPLASSCPILVCAMGGAGYVLYLHGTSGLKAGVRFPAARLNAVLERLKLEFGMDGKKPVRESWVEGRGRSERGLEDLTALLLPPLAGSAFVVEPRGTRR